ncbi:MAG: alpha/beta hydrolase [Bacteroidota bacterium]
MISHYLFYPEERTLENAGMLRLMDQFQLIFYDRRGSGLSQRFDKNEVSFQDQIDDLFTIIQLLTGENDQVNLLGHSFGGYLATAFINQHPDMVDHVILYEPRPFTQAAFDLLDITSVFEQIGENWIDEQTTVGIHISPDSHEKADYLRTIGASNQAVPEFKEPFDTPYWRLGSRVNIDIEKEVANDGVNIVNNLSGYTGEMLFLYGAKTEAAPDIDAYLNIMISYYPSGQRREIQQAAHLGLYENPEEVSQVVTDFILNQ